MYIKKVEYLKKKALRNIMKKCNNYKPLNRAGSNFWLFKSLNWLRLATANITGTFGNCWSPSRGY